MKTSSTKTAPKCNNAIDELVKKDIVNQETADVGVADLVGCDGEGI